MMPVPKAMLTSLIDKAVDMAKKSGIEEQDFGPLRDQIIKQGAEIAFNIMKEYCL